MFGKKCAAFAWVIFMPHHRPGLEHLKLSAAAGPDN